MNIIIRRFNQILEKRHFVSILNNDIFRFKLEGLFDKRTKHIHRSIFAKKTVEIELSKSELKEVFRIGKIGASKPVVTFDIKSGELKLFESCPSI